MRGCLYSKTITFDMEAFARVQKSLVFNQLRLIDEAIKDTFDQGSKWSPITSDRRDPMVKKEAMTKQQLREQFSLIHVL